MSFISLSRRFYALSCPTVNIIRRRWCTQAWEQSSPGTARASTPAAIRECFASTPHACPRYVSMPHANFHARQAISRGGQKQCAQILTLFDAYPATGPADSLPSSTAYLPSICVCCVCWVQGCKMRDHVVSAADSGDCSGHPADTAQTRLLSDLLLHRDAVCVTPAPQPDR